MRTLHFFSIHSLFSHLFFLTSPTTRAKYSSHRHQTTTMAAAFLDTTRNLSLYTIPAAWVLSIVPHFYAASLGQFDNRHPRTYTKESGASQKLDKGKNACPIASPARKPLPSRVPLFLYRAPLSCTSRMPKKLA